MLLSIDRVLQLISEGKSLDKISELAATDVESVVEVIDEARALLLKYEKENVKKKVKLKNKNDPATVDKLSNEKSIFEGSEFTAIPYNSTLIIDAEAYTLNKNDHSGIGIIIYDKESNQVGKISVYNGRRRELVAELSAVERALDVGAYFNSQILRIRVSMVLAVKMINREINSNDAKVQKLLDSIWSKADKIEDCKIELASNNLTEKAKYFAQQAVINRK